MTAPFQARAAVGFGTGNPALGFIGLYVIAGGAGTAGLGFLFGGAGFLSLGGLVACIGLIILDEKTGAPIFQELTPDAASKLGISNVEAMAYNEELDRINLINQTINENLAKDPEATAEKAADLWRQYQKELSPQSNSALLKIAQQAVVAPRN